MDFLIEIHPEDGFLGGEIRFWISRSNLGNPDLDFENLNPDFPIERTLRSFFKFHVVVVQKQRERNVQKKCAARAKLLFC